MFIEAKDLLDQLQSPDANVRLKACQSAGPAGAGAIPGLADLMASPDKSVAKGAKVALQNIAHYSARPGASKEAQAVTTALLKVADSTRPRMIRAEALNLVGVVGDGRAVPTLTKLLSDKEVREDARMALERIPGSASLNALKKAMASAPDDYKSSLKQSIQARTVSPQNVGLAMAR